MSSKITNPLGTIEIVDDVVSRLAGLSAIECVGVVGMASQRRASDGIIELLGRENLSRGVEINSNSDDSVSVELYIIVEYGVSILAVAQNIIDTVKYNIENMTGLNVQKVNVNVQGVRT